MEKIFLVASPLLFTVLAACGSIPPPSERLAQAESGVRAAQENGAQAEPTAALHLKMANDQIAQAKTYMSNDENDRASAILLRAQSDAELSLQLAKEAHAKTDAAAAMGKIGGMQSSMNGGAK